MAQVLSGRLHALDGANALVRRSFADNQKPGHGADLASLIGTILRPHQTAQHEIALDGPPLALGDRAVNSIALVLHELATNGAKYGCLKQASGSLHISWKVENNKLALIWRENGGPQIEAPPAKTGFGTTLLTSTVAGQLGGAVNYDWQPHGLQLSMSIPIERLQH